MERYDDVGQLLIIRETWQDTHQFHDLIHRLYFDERVTSLEIVCGGGRNDMWDELFRAIAMNSSLHTIKLSLHNPKWTHVLELLWIVEDHATIDRVMLYSIRLDRAHCQTLCDRLVRRPIHTLCIPTCHVSDSTGILYTATLSPCIVELNMAGSMVGDDAFKTGISDLVEESRLKYGMTNAIQRVLQLQTTLYRAFFPDFNLDHDRMVFMNCLCENMVHNLSIQSIRCSFFTPSSDAAKILATELVRRQVPFHTGWFGARSMCDRANCLGSCSPVSREMIHQFDDGSMVQIDELDSQYPHLIVQSTRIRVCAVSMLASV